MWPRLSRAIRDNPVTALVSVLASFLAFFYQLHQYHKECPDLPLPKCIIIIFQSNNAESEWKREVKNTDSEERIESFINKYKEGSYVELAQDRLKVAKAWTPIRNTTDPHTLFAFLSNYHDTVFEKLAENSLQRLAEREWEREIKSTDSEERIERFINNYKEGPYVTLAQERLKVARAWTSIKNTTDPRTLFDFLSYHHNSVFVELARDSLRRLDDRAWQLAVSAGTREAITTYQNTWSAFSGRHLQDAQIKLNELDDDDAWNTASLEDTPEAYRRYLANRSWTRHVAQAHKRLDELSEAASNADRRTYWDLHENDPEVKCVAISTMYSITEGAVVKFYYEIPSKCMKDLPVNKDTLKFEGEKNGKWYQGKAYVFTKYCGGKSIGYDMSGSENDDHTLITLRGPAPVIEKETCRVHHRTWDSMNSTLEFKARIPVESKITAKAKRGDKNNHID